MGKIVCKGTEIEVEDGGRIKAACEELGVIFGCDDGICRSCLIKVKRGMGNLNPPTQAEKDMGMEEGERLACQCKLAKGTVEIDF